MLDDHIKSTVVISIRLTQQFVENWNLPQIRSKPKVKTNLLESFLKNWKPKLENLSNYRDCHNYLKQPFKKNEETRNITKRLTTYQSLRARFSHLTTTDSSGVIILPPQTMHYKWEIPQIYHTFALFDPHQIGNLMIPVGGPRTTTL